MGADDFNKAKTNLKKRIYVDAQKFEEVVYDEKSELISGDYIVHTDKKAEYEEALQLLIQLGKEYPNTFSYEVDDPEKPYFYHSIFIKFRYRDDGLLSFKAKLIADIISKFDDISLDEEPISGEWQLGIQIYEGKS